MGPYVIFTKKQTGTQEMERLRTQEMETLHAMCSTVLVKIMPKTTICVTEISSWKRTAFPVTVMALQLVPPL